jgi:hypothetical protein
MLGFKRMNSLYYLYCYFQLPRNVPQQDLLAWTNISLLIVIQTLELSKIQADSHINLQFDDDDDDNNNNSNNKL